MQKEALGARGWLGFAAGVTAAAVPMCLLHGFTVDDALIPARYAAHLSAGLGYRFNSHGPCTDGVTPLGWAHMLAPFARARPLAALAAARWLGGAMFLASSGLLGVAVARSSARSIRFASLLLLVCSAPMGAWAVAGMETGVVMALATLAAVAPPRPEWSVRGGLLAGLLAWLRPEMIAFALVLGFGRAKLARSRASGALALALSALPWACVVLARTAFWGHPAPLAAVAKPSDLTHGAIYAVASVLLTGGPVAVFAPKAFARVNVWIRTLAAGALSHFVVVALVGGDWMPLSRLVVPVLPPLVLVAAHVLAATMSRAMAVGRLVAALAAEVYVFARIGPSAARVHADRMALVSAATVPLAGAERVAALDIGWVGAATPAEIVDLAGVTDPEIAGLAGGHTSKSVSGALLERRGVDRIVLQLSARSPGAGGNLMFERRVEQNLAYDPYVVRHYRIIWMSPESLPVRYVILAARPPFAGP
jgi:hypothetical protein